ncbi:hypothetical protein EXU57_09545 [Segetibacter sp. 3557_3]|uniref:DUF1186 domain-containing protein n=1 Tax=Segetibacter sp. 3557_3 TaxID=2547429 RepID=UPI001058E3FE|nr:DUF1186 domain-containing protein [Segetibacter sp. 3557_3]TDH27032.1 hypothetical protein EXU57_09545 [Segetibacter sp. 3557_3]
METAAEYPVNHIPEFRIKIVAALYAYGINLPNDVYQQLLQQDRDTLTDDLELVLSHAIRYYDDLQQLPPANTWFVWHALFLLKDLGTTHSLALIAELLKQEEALIHFYLGDEPEDFIRDLLASLFGTQLPMLVNIFEARKNDFVVRFAILEALHQIAVRDPESQVAVEECLNNLVNFITTRVGAADLFIEEVTEHLLQIIVQLNSKSLIDKVRPLIEEHQLPLYEDYTLSNFEEYSYAEQAPEPGKVQVKSRKEHYAEREAAAPASGLDRADDAYPEVIESLKFLDQEKAKSKGSSGTG